MSAEVLVIGLGNHFRSDDAIGLLIADELQTKGVRTVQRGDDLTPLLDDFKKSESILIVDAIQCDDRSLGEAVEIDATQENPIEEQLQMSTHSLDLLKTIELAKTLDGLPSRLHIYGVVGREFKMGNVLSEKLKQSVPTHVRRILGQIETWESENA